MKLFDLTWRHLIVAVGLFLISSSMYAQDEEFSDGYNISLAYDQMNAAPPPETWMFMKYGGQRPNLYTGTVQVTIPLYNYKDKDFEIPITLSYASNGYLPNVQASSVGLGWMLHAGGFITQEKNGKDDLDGSGYLSYIKEVPSSNRRLMSRISITQEGAPVIRHTDASGRTKEYETTPDIFSFNFCGHSGKFVITHAGIKVFNTARPSGEYKVDISKNITITTGDGYKYTFENSHENVCHENTYSQKTNCSNDGRWNLQRITAPNGRFVEFKYTINKYMNRRAAGLSNKFYEAYTGTWAIVGNEFKNFTSKPLRKEYAFFPFILSSRGSVSLLNTINIDNKAHIDFHYSTRKYYEKGWTPAAMSPGTPGQLTNSAAGLTDLSTPSKLDGIQVWRSFMGNRLLKNCTFDYEYAKTGNPVMMLKAVKISGEGTYQMKYYKSDAFFPYHGTPAIDHWGYYNGRTSDNLMTAIPDPDLTRFSYKLGSYSRDPDSEYAIQGMLSELFYPTGGSSVFKYESHDFSRFTEMGMGNNLTDLFNPDKCKIDETTWRTGGLRIESITDYKSSGEQAKSTKYIYKDYLGNRSGILTNLPKYVYSYWFPEMVTNADVMRNRVQAIQNLNGNLEEVLGYNANKTHIEYAAVQEVSHDGSYTIYNFSNSNDVGDQYGPGDCYYDPNGYDEGPQDELPVSLESQRGKLIRTEHFDNLGQMKSATEYHYDYGDETLPYIAQAKIAPFTAYEHWIYIDDYPLTGQTTTTYFGNNSIASTVHYKYNSQKQVVQTEQADNKGDTIRIRKTYAHEMAPSIIRDSVLSKNLFSLPLKTIKTVQKQAGEEQIVDAALYTYNLFNGWLLPASVATGCNLPLPITSEPDFKVQTSFDRYDVFGNLVQTTDKTGRTTSYVWGYSGLYILAKVEDTTIDKIISSGYPDILTVMLRRDILSIEQRKAITRWGSTTMYEYMPFVGITKITDPYGISTYYEYNDDFKLHRVLNHDKKVLKQFNYSTDNK